MTSVQLVRWRGGRMTRPFADSQAKVAEMCPGFVLTQGGWNAGGVAASAGTHDRDAADYSVRGKTRAEVEAFIRAQREVGNFASFRTTRVGKWGVRAQGFSSYHVHVVPNLWAHASAGAQYQAREYRAGRDGLRGRGPDAGGPGHVRTFLTRIWSQFLNTIKKEIEVITNNDIDKIAAAVERRIMTRKWSNNDLDFANRVNLAANDAYQSKNLLQRLWPKLFDGERAPAIPALPARVHDDPLDATVNGRTLRQWARMIVDRTPPMNVNGHDARQSRIKANDAQYALIRAEVNRRV